MSPDEFEVVGEFAQPAAFEKLLLGTMGQQVRVEIRRKLDELSRRRGDEATILTITFIIRSLVTHPPHFVVNADRVDVSPTQAIEFDSRTDPVTVRYVQTSESDPSS